MKNQIPIFLLSLSAVLLAAPASADDVTGKDKILCTTVQITECFADGGCEGGPPENWNIPRFTRIDLEQKTLKTTEASGQDRETPIERIEQEGNDIFIQGAEGGKAFTVLLDLDTGTATLAIALEGSVLAGFGVCTPIDSLQ